MGRRLSRAASLIDGFNAMYDTIGRVQRDRDLRQAATAMPTMDEGFTPEQGAQLQAAANSGQYDVEYDDASKAYKVIPKADPTMVGTIAPGQRQTFMGQVQDKPMDQAGISRARQMAMAGVLDKHGDIDGAARIRDRLAADEDRAFNRERVRTAAARDDVRWRREQDQIDAEKAYREGLAAVLDSTPTGQAIKAFNASLAKYAADDKAYKAKLERGEDAGPPPTKPTAPSLAASERLLSKAIGVEYLARHGKASPEMFDQVAQQLQNLNDEGYITFLRMAASGATPQQLQQAYDSAGRGRLPEGATLRVERGKRPGGVDGAIVTVKLPDGTELPPIDTYSELARFGKVEEMLKAAQQSHTQSISDRQVSVSEGNLNVNRAAEGRHQAEFRAGAPDREARAAVAKLRTELAETTDPARQQEIEGKIRALSTGTRAGSAASSETADVKLARVAMGAGMFTDMKDALAWAVRNKDASPEKVRADLYAKALTALGSPAAAKKATEEGMAYLYPNGAAGGAAAPAGGPLPEPKSPLEISRLAPGTRFKAPDGTIRIVPGR